MPLDIPPNVLSKILLSLAILGGVLVCFFGSRLLRMTMAIVGFASGAVAAAYGVWRYLDPAQAKAVGRTYGQVLHAMAASPDRTVILVWALVGAVVGAVLLVLLYRVGVFVLGVWLGVMVANVTMAQASADSHLIVVAILGLLGGVLGLVLRDAITVTSTAVSGALALMFGIYALLKNYSPHYAVLKLQEFSGDTWVLLGCTVVLAAVGGFVQISIDGTDDKSKSGSNNGEKKKKRKKRDSDDLYS